MTEGHRARTVGKTEVNDGAELGGLNPPRLRAPSPAVREEVGSVYPPGYRIEVLGL